MDVIQNPSKVDYISDIINAVTWIFGCQTINETLPFCIHFIYDIHNRWEFDIFQCFDHVGTNEPNFLDECTTPLNILKQLD